jgi:hypothetical protein
MNPLISSVVRGIDTNWFDRTHETMHNQATLTAPPCGATIGYPRFIDASAPGLPRTEEGSTAWYLRITLISEVNWTCPVDEYLACPVLD